MRFKKGNAIGKRTRFKKGHKKLGGHQFPKGISSWNKGLKKVKRNIISCKKCGKLFEVLVTQKRVYCSFRCYRDTIWRGGYIKANKTERYKKWREKVYERDNYTCQKCGQRGGKLHPHHIKSWAEYPKLRYRTSNGQTLCEKCHRKTPNFGINIWNNRCWKPKL